MLLYEGEKFGLILIRKRYKKPIIRDSKMYKVFGTVFLDKQLCSMSYLFIFYMAHFLNLEPILNHWIPMLREITFRYQTDTHFQGAHY